MTTRQLSLSIVFTAIVHCANGCSHMPATQDELLLQSAMEKSEHGDYTGAISDYSHAIELKPGDGGLYLDRGLAREAVGDFTRVIKNDGTDGWAFYRRGLARIYAGDHDEGCFDLRRAIDLGVEESGSALEELCQ